MMRALVSGSGGVAAIIKGNAAEFYNYGENDYKTLTKTESDNLFSRCDDVIELETSNKAKVLKRLDIEVKKTDSLLLLLGLLTEDLSENAKIGMASCLEDALSVDIIESYLKGVMYSRPLPNSSASFIYSSLKDSFPKCYKFLEELLASQDQVSFLHNAYLDACSKSAFGSDEKNRAEGILVNCNVNFRLISGENVGLVQFDCSKAFSCSSIENKIPFVSKLFQTLKSNFQPKKIKEPDILPQPPLHKVTSHKVVGKTGETPHQAYKHAKAQIERIESLLGKSDFSQARRFAEQLVSSQVSKGDSSFAAQSLCSLSEKAKKLEFYELQLEWALRAIEVEPEDYRSYGHVADAYLQLEDIENSRKYFTICAESDSEHREYGLTGLARIERELYNFDEGLAYIDRLFQADIDDINIYSLKAELQRDSGDLEGAISTYSEMSERFPQSLRSEFGLAAIFSNQKRLGDAEEKYKFIINSDLVFSEANQLGFAHTALGFVLARQGRFAEAHKHFDTAIGVASSDEIAAKTSKAKAFKIEGKFRNSEAILIELLGSHQSFVGPILDLINLYIDTDCLDQAAEYIEIAKDSYPSSADLQLVEARYLKKAASFEESLSVLDRLISSRPRMVLALLERASLFKYSGNYLEAKNQYLAVLDINRNERRAVTGLQVVSALLGEDPVNYDSYKSGLTFDPVVYDDYSQLGIYGLILLSRGDLKEAKDILLKLHQSKFRQAESKFAVALSLVRLKYNQSSAAIKSVKNETSLFGNIQKVIVYGEQGRLEKAVEIFNKVKHNKQYTGNVLSMLESRYFRTDIHGNQPSIDEVIDEQVDNLLKAA